MIIRSYNILYRCTLYGNNDNTIYYNIYKRYLGQYGRVRIEIDQAALASQLVVPSRFQMWYFHCVTNGLDMTGYLGGLRAENGSDAEPE